MRMINMSSCTGIILLLLGLSLSCQKKSLDDRSPHLQEENLLSVARDWYSENLKLVRSKNDRTNDFDLDDLVIQWDEYSLSENSAGNPVVTVPILSKGVSKAKYIELGLIVDKGEVKGMIKEYMRSPYTGKTRLNLYTGTGLLFLSGIYDSRSQKFRPLQTRSSSGIFKFGKLSRIASSGNDSGDAEEPIDGGEIDEVIVPPPSGGGGGGGGGWEDGGGGGDGGGGDYGGGGGGGGGVPTNPGGGSGGQNAGGDRMPENFLWRTKLSDGFDDHLEETTPQYIYDSEGNLIPNPNAFNCHYHTFSATDPAAIVGTLAAEGLPNWVVQVSLGQNWEPVSSGIKEGDVIIYQGISQNTHGWLHSGIVTKVDSEGFATEISSKMGTYEIITHHPRDIPSQYGAIGPTYQYLGQSYPSRTYYRKK